MKLTQKYHKNTKYYAKDKIPMCYSELPVGCEELCTRAFIIQIEDKLKHP